MIIIIAISTFVCISLGMLGVYWLLYKPQSAATERLRQKPLHLPDRVVHEASLTACELGGFFRQRVVDGEQGQPRADMRRNRSGVAQRAA